MSDEDNELRDLVMQTLEVNGTLGKIRAQLRANVFLALEEQDRLQNKSPFLNKDLKQFLNTKEGRLVGSLVREFLEFFNLDSSLAVFEPESGLSSDALRRSALLKELSVQDTGEVSKNPLLLNVFKQKQAQPVSSPIKQTRDELTEKQIKDAKEKFEYYDKDGNDSIDKDELRDLFMDMFPNFHRNMLDRYVNDEFKALDKDFSNSIDFDEFLSMYKRLFILCRSVVTGDTSPKSNTSGRPPKKDTYSSPLSSKSESISEKKDFSSGNNGHTNKNGKLSDGKDLHSFGSDIDDDSFFDDPLPNNNKFTNSENKEKSPLETIKKDTGSSFSLKDAPPLQPTKKKGDDSNKNLRTIDKRLEELGLGAGDDDLEYEDDFQSSGHSLSQKSPRLNSRSDAKSINENGSLAEEIEEDLEFEDFSIEGEDVKSAMDDLTTDCSISQADRGFDYVEDLQLP